MTKFTRISNKNNTSIIIDGQSYNGKKAELKLFIDGKEQSGTFSGNIKIEVHGDCQNIETMSGDVQVNGEAGFVKTMSGDIHCGKVSGHVDTMSGDIIIK